MLALGERYFGASHAASLGSTLAAFGATLVAGFALVAIGATLFAACFLETVFFKGSFAIRNRC